MKATSCKFSLVHMVVLWGLGGIVLSGCRSQQEQDTPPPVTETPEEERSSRARLDEIESRSETLAERQQSLFDYYYESARNNYERGRLAEARRDLAQALEIEPENEGAKDLFRKISSQMGDRGGEVADAFDSARDRQLVRIQEARFRADKLISEGRFRSEKEDYEGAIDAFENALTILEWFPYELDTTADKAQVRNLLEQARQSAEVKAKADAQEAAAKAKAEVEAQEEAAKINVERRISELYAQADKQFQRKNYTVVEKLCDDILELDPDQEPARELREVAVAARHATVQEQTSADYREEWKNAIEAIKLAAIPQNETVVYPENWDEISRRKPREFRTSDPQNTEEQEEIMNRLSAIEISPEFVETPLTDVATFFHQVSGVNFIVTKAVMDSLGESDRLVTFTVNRLRLLNVLNIVTQIKNLTWKIQDGVVKITTPEDARANVELQMIDVRDLVTPINDFPGDEITLSGSDTFEVFDDDSGDDEVSPAIQGDRLVQLIQENIATDQWDPPATLEIKEGTLIIRQTPEVLAKISDLLGDLRYSTGLMVAIESRFLTVEDNFLEDIGVDLRGLGDDSGGVGSPGQGTDAPLDDFGQPGSGFGTPDAPASLGSGNDAGVFYNVGGGDGDVRTRVENLFDNSLGSSDTLTSSGGTTIQYTYLDDVQIEAILRATKKTKRSNLVTQPRLLVHNNERASMSMITEVSYIKDFDVEIAQAAVIADPIVDLVREGVILDVKPVISSDRKYITMELRPTVSTLERPIPTFQTTLASGPPVAIQTPNLTVQRLRTTVTMPDRATLLIGGLKVSEERLVESGVPIIRQIPIINFLFSRKGTFNQKLNLLILLKAEIIILEEHEPRFGPLTSVR